MHPSKQMGWIHLRVLFSLPALEVGRSIWKMNPPIWLSLKSNSLSFHIPGQQFDGGFVHVEPLQQGVVSEFNELADGLSESFSIRLPSAADVQKIRQWSAHVHEARLLQRNRQDLSHFDNSCSLDHELECSTSWGTTSIDASSVNVCPTRHSTFTRKRSGHVTRGVDQSFCF